MLYDIDGDGTNDVGVVDKNGNLFWIRIGEFGQYLEDYHIQVPKLKIKRDWAVGLDPKFTDNYVTTSMFDHKTDRDNGRQYGYAGSNEGSLFDKKKKSGGGEKTATTGKIKLDDLGSLQVTQITYPELGLRRDEPKVEQDSEGALHGRRLLGDEFEEGVASDALSVADNRTEDTVLITETSKLERKEEPNNILDSSLPKVDTAAVSIDKSNSPEEKLVQNLAGTEKEAVSEQKVETKAGVVDAKTEKESKGEVQTKIETVLPPITTVATEVKEESVNQQKVETKVEIVDVIIDKESKGDLEIKSEKVILPDTPVVVENEKETVSEQKVGTKVDVADVKIEKENEGDLKSKSETVIPPVEVKAQEQQEETRPDMDDYVSR